MNRAAVCAGAVILGALSVMGPNAVMDEVEIEDPRGMMRIETGESSYAAASRGQNIDTVPISVAIEMDYEDTRTIDLYLPDPVTNGTNAEITYIYFGSHTEPVLTDGAGNDPPSSVAVQNDSNGDRTHIPFQIWTGSDRDESAQVNITVTVNYSSAFGEQTIYIAAIQLTVVRQ